MARKDKGKNTVTVYPDWCKGCGICVEFCPAKVLEISDEGKCTVVREDDCIRCGFCELHCPDFAIVVRNKESVPDQNGNSTSAKSQTEGKGV